MTFRKETTFMAMLRLSSTTVTRTTLVALLAIAIAGLVLLAPTTADAEPAHGTHIKYYNNSSHSTQVGFRYYNCDGVLESSWGVTSPYSSSATYGCLN
jgi:Family of unknown function (DUF6289)